MDIFFIAVVAVFFGVSVVLAAAFDRIGGRK